MIVNYLLFILFGFRNTYIQIETGQHNDGIPINPKQHSDQSSHRAVNEIIIRKIREIDIHDTQQKHQQNRRHRRSRREKAVILFIGRHIIIKHGYQEIDSRKNEQPPGYRNRIGIQHRIVQRVGINIFQQTRGEHKNHDDDTDRNDKNHEYLQAYEQLFEQISCRHLVIRGAKGVEERIDSDDREIQSHREEDPHQGTILPRHHLIYHLVNDRPCIVRNHITDGIQHMLLHGFAHERENGEQGHRHRDACDKKAVGHGRGTLKENAFHQGLAKEAHHREQRDMLKTGQHQGFGPLADFLIPVFIFQFPLYQAATM